jgi:hypothetical protein
LKLLISSLSHSGLMMSLTSASPSWRTKSRLLKRRTRLTPRWSALANATCLPKSRLLRASVADVRQTRHPIKCLILTLDEKGKRRETAAAAATQIHLATVVPCSITESRRALGTRRTRVKAPTTNRAVGWARVAHDGGRPS